MGGGFGTVVVPDTETEAAADSAAAALRDLLSHDHPCLRARLVLDRQGSRLPATWEPHG